MLSAKRAERMAKAIHWPAGLIDQAIAYSIQFVGRYFSIRACRFFHGVIDGGDFIRLSYTLCMIFIKPFIRTKFRFKRICDVSGCGIVFDRIISRFDIILYMLLYMLLSLFRIYYDVSICFVVRIFWRQSMTALIAWRAWDVIILNRRLRIVRHYYAPFSIETVVFYNNLKALIYS